jgi:hypothetical protein
MKRHAEGRCKERERESKRKNGKRESNWKRRKKRKCERKILNEIEVRKKDRERKTKR